MKTEAAEELNNFARGIFRMMEQRDIQEKLDKIIKERNIVMEKLSDTEKWDLLKECSTVRLSDLSEIKGAVRFTKEHLEELERIGQPLTDSAKIDMMKKELGSDILKVTDDYVKKELLAIKEHAYNYYDFSNFKKTLEFLKLAPSVPQFRYKLNMFERRQEDIKNATIYRFKSELIRLFVEKNNNDSGYRFMERSNMFLECFLDYGTHCITGIHIMKGKMNQAGEMVLIDDGQAIPSTFTDDVISVFCVGYTNFDKGKEIENFYTCFTLDKAKTLEIENKKKYAKYACPKCNSPMVHFTDNEIGCNHPPCIWGLQKGLMIVYDLNDAKVKHVFKSQEFSGVWGIEEKLRLFVTNLLDFITIKEVHISGFLSEEERRHKNEKRAEKGKEPLMPVKLINVTGHLYKYIGSIKQRYGDDAERMLREQSIKGHFFRFWSEEKWSRLYALLKGCKDDDSKEKRLAKAIRRDEDSHPLPDYQQYMWDKGLQKIKIWKEPTIRNKGCGKKDETPKVYVLGGKQDESI